MSMNKTEALTVLQDAAKSWSDEVFKFAIPELITWGDFEGAKSYRAERVLIFEALETMK